LPDLIKRVKLIEDKLELEEKEKQVMG
jgi:hypothetical protein